MTWDKGINFYKKPVSAIFTTKIYNKVLAESFKKDAECFTKAGLQLAEIIFGKYSSDWKISREKLKRNISSFWELPCLFNIW